MHEEDDLVDMMLHVHMEIEDKATKLEHGKGNVSL
jgi:hypothetical protein